MTALVPNIENIKLGACDVMYGSNDLGYTKGGVDVTIGTTSKEINVDQFGDTAVNEYIQGRMVTVKIPMAESDLQKLALAIPGSVLTIDHTDATKMKLVVSVNQGMSLRDTAIALVLHPTANISANKIDDFIVPLAAPSGNIEFAYNYNNERVYTVTFKGYPDQSTGALYTFGDPSAAAS